MGGLAQRKESSLRSLNYPPSMHLSFTFNNHFPFFVVVAVVVVVVFFFSRFRLFFCDMDVCTCSFEPLEHFFYIFLLLELKWPIIVLCHKLLCFTWISVPEKTLNTSSEIMSSDYSRLVDFFSFSIERTYVFLFVLFCLVFFFYFFSGIKFAQKRKY